MPKVTKKKTTTKKTKKASSRVSSDVTIAKTKSVPSDRFEDYSSLFYGDKKIGKTSLMSCWEQAYFFMFEPGGRALSIYQDDVSGDWGKFKKLVTQFLRTKYNPGVVDTTQLAYKACLDYVCRKMVIDHPSEEEFGKGWEAVRDEFTREMNRLLGSEKGITFLSHARVIEIRSRRQSTISRIEPAMPKQAREIIDAAVDIWGYYCYDGDQRVLQIEGDEVVSAGNRCKGHFVWPDGEPIKMIPMGNSEQEAHDNLLAAFNNELPREGQPEKKSVNITKKKSKTKVAKKKVIRKKRS